MVTRKKILIIIIMVANIASISLFANNTSADISSYNDNYETMIFSNYGGGETVPGKPNSVRLPIEAYYTPNIPYAFTLTNGELVDISNEEIYQTPVYDLTTDVESEQFTLSVIGNESDDKIVNLKIDYEPYFYSKETPTKSSNIAINYVAGYELSSDLSAIPKYTFQLGTIVNNIIQNNSSYTRVPYSLYLKKGPQNLKLLAFSFTWPIVTDSNFPTGFYSNELLKSQVLIEITS